jgi:hypothetical protein
LSGVDLVALMVDGLRSPRTCEETAMTRRTLHHIIVYLVAPRWPPMATVRVVPCGSAVVCDARDDGRAQKHRGPMTRATQLSMGAGCGPGPRTQHRRARRPRALAVPVSSLRRYWRIYAAADLGPGLPGTTNPLRLSRKYGRDGRPPTVAPPPTRAFPSRKCPQATEGGDRGGR